ncbi:MAG TPA: hypothetical protein VGO68_05370 [Pyrinomonadaceae bacterium]|jgi:hypothetical protein|nr:hypothetical protein [Pyrinomonadaceae bacterium]
MNETVGDMSVRRVTLADGRYLIFYEFSGDILQREVAGAQREETKDESADGTDRGSSV